MSKIKHTPGPWEIEGTSQSLDDYLVGPCSVTGEANAKLVSSAPDLLLALKTLADNDILNVLRHDLQDLAFGAINKAEGNDECP